MDVPAITGPPPGFRELYDTELDRTWRVLARLGVPDAAIEDALQDVFVTAYRSWYRLRDPSQRRAWLMGITRRIAFRHRRGHLRHLRKLDALGHVGGEPPAGPEEALQLGEARARLRAFVDGLDPSRRDAFVLGELEELDRKQLGAALGINPNTAYSRLASARRDFARCFGANADALVQDCREEQAPEPVHARAWLLLTAQWGPPPAAPIAIAAATKWAVGAAVVVAGVLAAARPSGGSAARAPSAATVDRRGDADTRPSPATVPVPATVATPPVVVAAVPAPSVDAPRVVARTSARGSRSDPAAAAMLAPEDERATTDGIDAEAELLGRARRAAVAGDHEDARRLLDEHRQRFGDDARMRAIRDRIAARLDAP